MLQVIPKEYEFDQEIRAHNPSLPYLNLWPNDLNIQYGAKVCLMTYTLKQPIPKLFTKWKLLITTKMYKAFFEWED